MVQLRRGAKYWAYDCAGCHGLNGEGGQGGPRVIGPGALPLDPRATAKVRKEIFAKASDVLVFTRRHMPSDFAGLATDEYYWDVTAFVLSQNGIDLHGRVLDPVSAEFVLLHAK